MDFTRVRNYLFLGLLLLVTFGFLLILQPFAYSIFWAAVMAALFYPLFARLERRLKHPNLSATITLSAVAVILIIPLSILSVLMVREAFSVYSSINRSGGAINETILQLAENIKHNRFTAELAIDETFWTQKFAEVGQTVVNYIFQTLSEITQNSLKFLALFVIMFYSLFFFIRDGEKILKKLMYLLPLGDKYELMLYKKFTAAASAIIKGTLIMGGVQGAIGGLVFWIAGIEGALIWSVIMLLASLIPGIGAAIIWFPAGVIMLLAGQTWQGLFILLVGFFIVSTIDNLLRPMIVGKDLKMPALLILFSTLGGIAVFNFSGFMIGPIIAALFLSFWEMYEEFYRKDLQKN